MSRLVQFMVRYRQEALPVVRFMIILLPVFVNYRCSCIWLPYFPSCIF